MSNVPCNHDLGVILSREGFVCGNCGLVLADYIDPGPGTGDPGGVHAEELEIDEVTGKESDGPATRGWRPSRAGPYDRTSVSARRKNGIAEVECRAAERIMSSQGYAVATIRATQRIIIRFRHVAGRKRLAPSATAIGALYYVHRACGVKTLFVHVMRGVEDVDVDDVKRAYNMILRTLGTPRETSSCSTLVDIFRDKLGLNLQQSVACRSVIRQIEHLGCNTRIPPSLCAGALCYVLGRGAAARIWRETDVTVTTIVAVAREIAEAIAGRGRGPPAPAGPAGPAGPEAPSVHAPPADRVVEGRIER